MFKNKSNGGFAILKIILVYCIINDNDCYSFCLIKETMMSIQQVANIQQHTQASEAIRAFFTLQCCWLNNEEVYLEQGCLHCGSAATYLIFYTNRQIQKLMLDFIGQHNCIARVDLRDLPHFEQNYEQFLQILEQEVNAYARSVSHVARCLPFEQVDSIFERQYAIAC